MSNIIHELSPQGMTVIEHVSQAWRLLLQLPDPEHARVNDYLGGTTRGGRSRLMRQRCGGRRCPTSP
jgi:hypothetical protein